MRIYHEDFFTKSATHRRDWGPLHRFDHHTPPLAHPTHCPENRTVIYLAESIRAAAAEVFSEYNPFRVCPHWRLAWLRPAESLVVQDIVGAGGMAIEAGEWLGSGPAFGVQPQYTQEWARKIYDDHNELQGIRYSGSHEGSKCLVLTDRAPELEVVLDGGVPSDNAIVESEIWDEVVVEYLETGHTIDTIASADCDYCKDAAAAEAAAAAP